MPRKRTLYDILQVGRQAGAEVIAAAGEARLRELGESAAPEVAAERAVIREAIAILSDPVRRKLYDEKLREEALRALAAGGDEEARARPANARPALDAQATVPASSPLGWLLGVAVLAAVIVFGSGLYLDHKRKAEAQRIERERLAEELRLKQEEEERRRELSVWAKDHYDRAVARSDERYQDMQRQRERAQWSSEQQRAYREQLSEQRRAEMEQRRAEYERHRMEQEDLRRQQQQLERDRRHLRELEANRPMKF